jgi:hypothetical protein
MSKVSLHSDLSYSPESAFPKLANELQALSVSHDLKLSVDMSDLQLPLEGEILVRVRPQFVQADDRTFKAEISASVRKGLYPKFVGTLRLRPAQGKKSVLLLEGNVEIPLGLLGRSVNATLFSGAASKSLQRFLDVLAEAVSAQVKREEEEYARSVHFTRTP